jgi:ABC-type sugar transport system ATPase subunit
MSFLTGELRPANGGMELRVAGLRLEWTGSGAVGRVVVGVRPEDVRLVSPGDGDAVGRVDVVEPLGAALLAHIAMAGEPEGELLRATVAADEPVAEGQDVGLRFHPGRVHLFAVDTGARIPGQAAGE